MSKSTRRSSRGFRTWVSWGLEAHYANYNAEEQRLLFDLAKRYGLLPCGGSDYHAMGNENEALPGADGPPADVLEALERLSGEG